MSAHLPFPPAGAAPKLLLSTRDAARALSVSERTLWTWTQAGEIPHLRIGGRVLYPVDALREWIAAQTQAPQTAAAGPADHETGRA